MPSSDSPTPSTGALTRRQLRELAAQRAEESTGGISAPPLADAASESAVDERTEAGEHAIESATGEPATAPPEGNTPATEVDAARETDASNDAASPLSEVESLFLADAEDDALVDEAVAASLEFLREHTPDAAAPADSPDALSEPEPIADPVVPPTPLPETGDDDTSVVDTNTNADADETSSDTASAAAARWADDDHAPTALAWLTPDRVGAGAASDALDGHAPPLLGDVRLRRRAPWSVIGAFLALVALVAAYAVTMILWPLHEVAPVAEAIEVDPVTGPVAEIEWPAEGTAAVGVRGLGTLSNSEAAVPMASLTKVVSALLVLDRMPLSLGESGPSYSFSNADSRNYWAYRNRGESALDVPAGGSLTEYQLLQGTLMGSANNYINRLSRDIWGANANFSAAAREWLDDRQLSGIVVTDPSGIERENVADPASLIALAELAIGNPVIREITGTPVAAIPGAGDVQNTNPLIGQPGVNGLKTGAFAASRNGGVALMNLLATKEVEVDGTAVLLSVVVLGHGDHDSRTAAAESLFAQLEQQLTGLGHAVPAGSRVGTVQTQWGEQIEIVTDQPTSVLIWNGATANNTVSVDLGDSRDAGERVGTLTTIGPLDTDTTTVSLGSTIEGPSVWWRLTHPLELLGISDLF